MDRQIPRHSLGPEAKRQRDREGITIYESIYEWNDGTINYHLHTG